MAVVERYENGKRKDQFDYLKSCVKPTPLVRLEIDIPNNNKIFAKLEGDCNYNPNGTHYDRAYPRLLEDAEINGIPTPAGKWIPPISPKTTHIVEVTTGNASISAAWVASAMGYDITIIVPENLPRNRLRYTEKYGARIIEVERKNYVAGAVEKLTEMLTIIKQDEKGRRYRSLNHSFNPITTEQLSNIMHEAWEQSGQNIDCFVSTAGNGASTLGTSKVLKKYNPGAEIVCWDQFRSGLAYDKHYPGKYQEEFGIEPGQLFNILPQPKDKSRELLGNFGPGTRTPFLDQTYAEGLVAETLLVIDDEMLDVYSGLIKDREEASQKVAKAEALVRWDGPKKLLEDSGYHVGNTSIGSTAVALELAKKVEDKSFMLIFYDMRDKYTD
jgi:cysteine synthase